MPIITVFYIKLLLSAVLTSAILWSLWKSDLFKKWQLNHDRVAFAVGFFLFRLLPWIGIFLVLDFEPRGDVPFFFYKAEHAKAGGFVYRDFWSYHAPLYSYLISLPLWLWHNARAIVLLMVAMESVILWYTYQAYKPYKENALQLAFLYWLLPASFMYIMIDGQEEIWFWGIGLLMWRYTLKHREGYEIGLGLFFALALLTLKATFVFLLPALLLVVRRPIKMLLTMAAIGIPAMGILYFFIGDLFLMPIRHTEQLMTPNLFSITRPVIEWFVHIDSTNSTIVNWVGLLFTVLLPCLAAWKSRGRHVSEVLPGLFILSYCGMMLFQASAPGAYIVAFLVVVVFQIIDVNKRVDVAVILALGWLTVVQPFVNVYIGQPEYTHFSMFAEPKHLLDLLLQVLNVLCFIWIAVKAWNDVVASKRVSV
jgi:hypothetical protein